ncbi:hypothetical protein AUP68_00961 [Ilyonectria robusta]
MHTSSVSVALFLTCHFYNPSFGALPPECPEEHSCRCCQRHRLLPPHRRRTNTDREAAQGYTFCLAIRLGRLRFAAYLRFQETDELAVSRSVPQLVPPSAPCQQWSSQSFPNFPYVPQSPQSLDELPGYHKGLPLPTRFAVSHPPKF